VQVVHDPLPRGWPPVGAVGRRGGGGTRRLPLVDRRDLQFAPDRFPARGIPGGGAVHHAIGRCIEPIPLRRLARYPLLRARTGHCRLRRRALSLLALFQLRPQALAVLAHLAGGNRRPAKALQGLLGQAGGQQG
jgi:hypothetical protein